MEREYYKERISIKPDLGDQRQSTFKALPSPPSTPKRIMHKMRISAVVPFLLALASFVLTTILLLAGNKPGMFKDEYMAKLNTSQVGQDLIKFERATATSEAPSATSSSASDSSSPLDPLNPFSPDNPLNPENPGNPLSNLTDMLDPIVNNITDSINDGLGDAINEIVTTVVEQAGVKDAYFLYLERICEGNFANGSEGNSGIIDVEKCSRYDDPQSGINSIAANMQSSVVIANTNISVPLISEVIDSLSSMSNLITPVRKTIFAFLVISAIGSGLSMLTSIPSVIFSQSRLLVYFNILWALLATTFGFLAAIILTVLILGINQTIGGFGSALGIYIKKGGLALLIAWLSWVFIWSGSVYWTVIWFVEFRSWSFIRRQRSQDEKGNWKGISREVLRDLKGEKVS